MVHLKYLLIAVAILILAIVLFYGLFFTKHKTIASVKPYLTVFSTISARIHTLSLLLSLGRYIIFSIQFYLILHWLQIDITPADACVLLPITFFLMAVIPTFALSELGVRGATAIFVLGTVSLNTTGILAASLFLWFINLAFPALVGLFFIVNLNFFKSGN
jgi:hypothetical protein